MIRIKSFISTRAEYLDEKVNKWLEENPGVLVKEIRPYMSYTAIKDKGAYMIGVTVLYDKNPQ